jgi:hypothetical protein
MWFVVYVPVVPSIRVILRCTCRILPSVWRFNSSTEKAQEHVPVDPASSASIQIPHDVVRIACHWLWKLLKKIGQIPFFAPSPKLQSPSVMRVPDFHRCRS